MKRRPAWIRLTVAAPLVLALVAAPVRVVAADDQSAAAQSSARSRNQPKPDFLFGRPSGSIGVRGSWSFLNAGSDLYDFVTTQLTLDKKDFNAPGVGAYFNRRVASNLDAQFGLEFQKSNTPSSYRNLVDNNLQEIEQTTEFRTLSLTGSLRYNLVPQGRSVSRFAWVPSRIVPYVGGGGGVINYEFMQTGDFVDFADSSVFPDVFRSSGWAPSVHAFTGVDVQVFRALYATIEGRYTKASAKLGTDFVDFDPIDLSGFKVSAGINLLF